MGAAEIWVGVKAEMSDKNIVISNLNNSQFSSDKEYVRNSFHYVLKPDGSWTQFIDDKNSEKIVIGCVRDSQGELYNSAQNAGLKELLRILSARHKVRVSDISFESDGLSHQNLGNICTEIDGQRLELWRGSDVALIDGRAKKMPEKMVERKGILFAPLLWLMNALGFEKLEADNYLKFWRKK